MDAASLLRSYDKRSASDSNVSDFMQALIGIRSMSSFGEMCSTLQVV